MKTERMLLWIRRGNLAGALLLVLTGILGVLGLRDIDTVFALVVMITGQLLFGYGLLEMIKSNKGDVYSIEERAGQISVAYSAPSMEGVFTMQEIDEQRNKRSEEEVV